MTDDKKQKVRDLMGMLNAAYEERNRLEQKLNKCTDIMLVCPTAFAHGACKTQVVCGTRTGGDRMLPIARLVIVKGNGESVDMPLAEVPRSLWPDDIIKQEEQREKMRMAKERRVAKERLRCKS